MTIFAKGIIMPTDSLYFILTILVLAFTLMIAEPFLKFLTIKCNFLTFFIMASLLLIGVMFLLKLFMVGFYIKEFTFEGMILGSLNINSFVISPIATIISSSVITALIGSIYKTADSV